MLTLGPLLQHDAESRPDFAGIIYAPWSVSPITEDATPLFILCAADVNLCALSSAELFSAYKRAAKSVELHIYSKGGHGFGMQKRNRPVNSWIERFYEWMTAPGF
jgi:acetyl esterase/lipase